MRLVAQLELLGGAARVGQLARIGVGRHMIRRGLVSGEVTHPAHGVIALPGATSAAVLAVVVGAEHTCVSALAAHGLPVPRRIDVPHLAVPHGFTTHGRELGAAVIHYVKGRKEPGGLASVSAALDCAGNCLDEVWHLVAVDAALNAGRITMADIVELARTSRERREFLVRHADPRAESPAETIARLRLVQAGFRVRPQAYVDGAGRVDLEVDGTLLLQIDGYEHHSDRAAFKRDREKGRAIIKAGRPLLSYAASELLGAYTANIVHDVTRALEEWRSRGSRRTPRSST